MVAFNIMKDVGMLFAITSSNMIAFVWEQVSADLHQTNNKTPCNINITAQLRSITFCC